MNHTLQSTLADLTQEELMETEGGVLPLVLGGVFVVSFAVGWATQSYLDRKDEQKYQKMIDDSIQKHHNSVTNSVYGD